MYSYVLYYNIDKSGFNAVSAYLLFEFVAICNFFSFRIKFPKVRTSCQEDEEILF